MTHKLVRLKAYDPKRGFILRRLTVRGITFKHSAGWYRVHSDIAAYLDGVRQRPRDEHSPKAFDVKSEEEARVLEEKEASDARQKKSTVEAPTVEAREAREESRDGAQKERAARSAKSAPEQKKGASGT